jgi:hypothetical protein
MGNLIKIYKKYQLWISLEEKEEILHNSRMEKSYHLTTRFSIFKTFVQKKNQRYLPVSLINL